MTPAPVSQTSSPSHSQTQSTFVSTSTSTRWDVFLSFRGTDTRHTFTGHLHNILVRSGINTFKDDPELRSGEVISDALLDAIRESKTYIVVLSQNYVSSTWCLDELVEIFNCHKAAERLVIPVFYKVHPFVVRHQIGSFEQAFKKHRARRVKMEKLNKWRLALARVAGLSGFHISENTSEADINNQIVEEILPKINPKVLEVAKYPVGLDSRVKVLTALLNTGTQEGFTKIGLYGMGGVGKTTLAKALFNQLLRTGSFKGSCFLENVREVSRSKGIESLQKIFINAVLNCKPKIKVNNSGEGKMLIKERICSIKVLVLIDDIDDYRQYESLVGSFASGSVVITTTRDQMMLDTIGVESKFQYRVNELDDAESLALFTRHAFRNAEQNNTLMVLSADVLRLADGLPLALEVFGSYLYNKSEVGWKSYIKKLQRAPDNSIQQKLIISLNAIKEDDPMLEEIFLDIACFFIRWDKEKVVTILETYYEFADHKIDILKKKGLVKINYDADLGEHEEPELDMHDLLRDMGRQIVRNISPDEPGRRSRLWVSEDIHDGLKNHEGTEKIECIIFPKKGFPPEEIAYTTKTFERMRKLRFLYLNKVNLTGSFEHTFHDLRWLRWDQCPLECLPSEFYPKNLVILELPDSNMRTMWELNMGSQVFGKLKTLNMSDSKDLCTTPDFTKLPCLETLDLHGCRSLEMVHVSIGTLGKLVSINFEGCKKLRTLPDSICSLRALKVLTISECNSLEAMPAQLGNIISLTELNAVGLTVSKLPDSIGNLTKLVELDLSRNNKKLETLPDTICNLRSLEILDISHCSSLEALPTAIGNIESLKMIDGSELTVSKLPDSIGNLTKLVVLDLSNNKKLETLPDTICNLRSLVILDISGCSSLEALPTAIGNIESLKMIDGRELTVSKLPDSIGNLTKLVELDLSNNKKLETLPDTICKLRSLEILDIFCCSSLEALPNAIGNIETLKKINGLGLTVSKLPDSIGSLTKLVELDLSYNNKLETLPDTICNLGSLEILDITRCERLETLPDQLWKITSLRKLDAGRTTLLKKLPDIGSSQNALSLQELNLSFSGITALPSGFSQLSNLEELDLSKCKHLLSIPSELTPNLKRIKASDCSSLERIPNLSNLKHLETLDLTKCTALTQIQGLEELTSITCLYLRGLSRSLMAYNLTKQLFQLYSKFGHRIRVHVPEFINWERDCDWITESPYWTSESSESRTVYAHLLPNQSHNFMGIILCFRSLLDERFGYSVKNTTSGFIWSDCLRIPLLPSGSVMVIVPKSIFSITDDDHTIEFTADKILGIHLLYNTETGMIEDVAKKHVIDIDALKLVDPVLQAIFLDIACFFNRWKKEKVVQILETYYSNVDQNIDILKKRCLLTIDDSDELEMNDLLQHIGRKIARNNSPDDPGRHSRLWLSSDIYDVLKKHEGTEAIQGIIPRKLLTKDALEGESFTTETFKRMSKLRFLYLKKVNFKGGFEQAFKELRWFCWDSCPLNCLPSNFCPQELVILELPHSNMRTFREPNMVSNVFRKLKTLNMKYSQDLITTPDFIELPCLENLNLGYCKSLEDIHISIGSLMWLVSLNLHGCVKLRSLPDTICNLRSLEALNIYGCEKLEILPDRLWKITTLRKLNANLATLLKKLPDIGSNQIALSLQELILSQSGITALPSGFSQLSNLQYLNLNSCDNLFSIPKLPSNLKQIYASGCFSLERLPNLSNLKQLEELNLSYCSGLTKIQGLEELSSIRRLGLKGGRRISLLAYKHLTQRLFLLYSEFGHQIRVYAPDFLRDFLRPQSSESSRSESTVNADLLPNESHNFRGIILYFKRRPNDYIKASFDCSVKNTTSGFIWRSDSLDVPSSELLMVLVPKSIFYVTDDDNRIELTANNIIIVGIHLLYKKETATFEDIVKKHETGIDELNSVDPVLQDIFLDIACCFIGVKRKKVVSILETYYPDVNGAIDILKNRCLLTINNADELEMNDLLQHKGKMIARNNSPDEPGKHSRLWLSIDIHDVLKKHTGTEMIKSIIPRNVYPQKDALEGESFTSEAFKKMSKLRFLYLKNANISGSFQQVFEDLRWLRWDSCPLKCFPSTFHPQKLVTLMLPNSNMRTMWEPNMVSHVFEKLTTLNMSFSQDLTRTPDFSKLPCLVTLILKGCKSLEEVHISIGSLVSLVILNLHGCVKLRSLPHSICNLRALKVLDIHDCCSLEALGPTKSLTELVAEKVTVSKLPDSIEHLSKLVELRYSSNHNFETPTDTICNLRSLEILDISGCKRLEIVLNQVLTHTRLRELNAGGATLMKIHPNIGLSQMALSLQKLDFSDSALTALPSAISQLTKVEYLDLKDCRRLLSITELPPHLKRIRASGCKSMQRFPNLSNLKQLKILELTDCSALCDIQGLKGLTSLIDLHLEGCNSTFLAYIFTKCFFQIFSEFGHPIQIFAPLAEFPYWITQSSEYGSAMCLELLPNVSHHFLGMILCFKSLGSSTIYTIKNTTSNFKWSGSFNLCSRNPLMVIVPRSNFYVSNGDDRIELTTKDAEIYGIHLLYKTKGYDCD